MATRANTLTHSPGEIPLADHCELLFSDAHTPSSPSAIRHNKRGSLALPEALTPNHSGHHLGVSLPIADTLGTYVIGDIRLSEALILPIGLW